MLNCAELAHCAYNIARDREFSDVSQPRAWRMLQRAYDSEFLLPEDEFLINALLRKNAVLTAQG